MKKHLILSVFLVLGSASAQAECAKDDKDLLGQLKDSLTEAGTAAKSIVDGVVKTTENSVKTIGAEVGNVVTDNHYEKPEKIVEFNLPKKDC